MYVSGYVCMYACMYVRISDPKDFFRFTEATSCACMYVRLYVCMYVFLDDQDAPKDPFSR